MASQLRKLTATACRTSMNDSLAVLQALQSNGLKWMSLLKSAEQARQGMLFFLTRLGIDVSTLPAAIHIAGTKGKGSTAAMAESILLSAGFRVGLFTSPHLVSACERFRVQGKPVDEETYLREFWAAIDTLGEEIYFEGGQEGHEGGGGAGSEAAAALPFARPPGLPGFNLLTLLAFKLFSSMGVEVMVLECGLGGRLDATNCLPPVTWSSDPLSSSSSSNSSSPSGCVVCSGVSRLDFDHCEILGSTLPMIAGEKAGIFRPLVPAVTVSSQRKDAMARLRQVARDVGTPLFQCSPEETVLPRSSSSSSFPALSLDAPFQRENAALAVALTDLFRHQLKAGRVPRLSAALANESNPRRREIDPEWLPLPIPLPIPLSRPLASSSASSDPTSAAGVSAAAAATAAVASPSHQRRRRLSPVFDSFGSSSASPFAIEKEIDDEGDVVAPPFYRPSEPLTRAVLEGLRKAKWAGRAHTLEADPETGKLIPIPSSPSSLSSSPLSPAGRRLRVFVDGAHTEASMREAVKWFASYHGQASEEALRQGKRRPPRAILVFNCGFEKDALQLLLPLSVMSGGAGGHGHHHHRHLFDRVFITTVPWVLTPRKPMPTTEDALKGYLERKRMMEDNESIALVEKAMETMAITRPASLPPSRETVTAATPPPPAEGGAVVAPVDRLRWQRTLADLWRACHERQEFRLLREAMLTRLQDEMDKEKKARAADSSSASSSTSAVPVVPSVPSAAPPTSVLPSFAEVWSKIVAEQRQQQCGGGGGGGGGSSSSSSVAGSSSSSGGAGAMPAEKDDEKDEEADGDTLVFVTGSLYLVGSALEHLGWEWRQ